MVCRSVPLIPRSTVRSRWIGAWDQRWASIRHFRYGADEQKAADVPAGEACGPAVVEQGHEFFKVADVPGWQDYDFPELRK
jgi:hypothetical protein